MKGAIRTPFDTGGRCGVVSILQRKDGSIVPRWCATVLPEYITPSFSSQRTPLRAGAKRQYVTKVRASLSRHPIAGTKPSDDGSGLAHRDSERMKTGRRQQAEQGNRAKVTSALNDNYGSVK